MWGFMRRRLSLPRLIYVSIKFGESRFEFGDGNGVGLLKWVDMTKYPISIGKWVEFDFGKEFIEDGSKYSQ